MSAAMEWAIFSVDLMDRIREVPSLGRHATYAEAKAVADKADREAYRAGLVYLYRAELAPIRRRVIPGAMGATEDAT